MRAVVHSSYGSPEVLEVIEMEKPVPRSGEVLVKVYSASINHYDILSRLGIKQDIKLPRIAGMDCSGKVEVHGGKRTDIKAGDRVLILGETLGLGGSGAFSEFVVVPENEVYTFPDSMSFDEASCIGISCLTAYYASNFFPGKIEFKDIFIPGGSGGVGSSLIQILKSQHNQIYTIARTSEMIDRLRSIGADHVFVGYTKETEKLIKIVSQGGCDYSINSVGGETISFGLSVLKENGIQLAIGSAAGRKVEIDIFDVLIREQKLIGVNFGKQTPEFRATVYRSFLELWEDGLFEIQISAVYELDDIINAFHYIEDRNHFGKVVVRVSGQTGE